MTAEGETLYMDIYDNGFVSNEYKEKFKHLINNFYVGVEENNHLVKELEEYKNGNFVQTVNEIIEGKDKRLEQAKEIIRTFLNMPMPNNEEVFADVGIFLTKAEQFLKGENIILEDAQAGNSPFDADEVFNKEMKAYPKEK